MLTEAGASYTLSDSMSNDRPIPVSALEPWGTGLSRPECVVTTPSGDVFVPEWRLSPYFTLGTGVIYTEPKSTLVQSVDRDDQIGYVGGGLQFYLTRRFMLRTEYRNNIVFTSRDDNEEVDEWKYLGFAFFF